MEELIQKYTNEHSKFLNIKGLDVHYRDEGEGDVVLLLHGTFSSLHSYDGWTEILKSHFRVVRMDLPGFGLTGPSPEKKYGIELFTEFLKDFIDAIGISKCTIVGNSLGGWLSWEFALKYQECVSKMILLDSAGYIDDRNFPLPFVIAQTPVLRNVFNYVPKAVVRRFVRQVYYDQTKVTDEVVDRYFDLFHRDGNKEAFVRLANCYFAQNTDNLVHLNIPVLLMWGKNDNWLNVSQVERFKQDINDLSVILYDKVGHVPMEEIPTQSGQDALEFLLN